MKKIDWLEKHSDATTMLFDIVSKIRSLANAFSITGNVHMSMSLKSIAFNIEKANKDIHDAIGESIRETVKRSEESSKAIVEAALAGSKLKQ